MIPAAIFFTFLAVLVVIWGVVLTYSHLQLKKTVEQSSIQGIKLALDEFKRETNAITQALVGK
jgi:hypothetical protein